MGAAITKVRLYIRNYVSVLTARRASYGFTLVELSIVIVIIGLIVAGITAGQSLVHQSRLKSITTDKSKYEVAVNSFLMQYNALPGDIANADSYWPGCNSGATAADCNGDGNRKISGGTLNNSEPLRAWQHLTLANLINGSYTGVATSGIQHTILNVPASSFNNGLWAIFHNNYGAWTTPNSILSTKLRLQVGREWTNLAPFMRLISPLDAYSIDKKYDDGLPQAGKILAINGNAYFIGTNVTAEYDVSIKTTLRHVLSFEIGN